MNHVPRFHSAGAALALLVLTLLCPAAAHAVAPSNAEAAAQVAGQAGVDPSRIEVISVTYVGSHQEGDQIIEEYHIEYRILPDPNHVAPEIGDALRNILNPGTTPGTDPEVEKIINDHRNRIHDAPGAGIGGGIGAVPPIPPDPGRPAWDDQARTPLEADVIDAITTQCPRPMTPKVRAARAKAWKTVIDGQACQATLAHLPADERKWLDEDPSGYRLRLAYLPGVWVIDRRRAETFLEAEKAGRIPGFLEVELFPDSSGLLSAEHLIDEIGTVWDCWEARSGEDAIVLVKSPSYLHWVVDCRPLDAGACRELEGRLSDLAPADRERFVLLFKADKDR